MVPALVIVPVFVEAVLIVIVAPEVLVKVIPEFIVNFPVTIAPVVPETL